ncbi:MAG: 50S ribosomal protein L23 [Oscillospiraceae bacterium]|nr:50S ribosomal protein L23 [Oscillospiraceae bacterium]
MSEAENKKYAFQVAPDANKIEIRRAVEEIFGVEVESVNTLNVRGKKKRMGVHIGRRPDTKKAVVRLTRKSKAIEFFEGMV